VSGIGRKGRKNGHERDHCILEKKDEEENITLIGTGDVPRAKKEIIPSTLERGKFPR